MHWFLTQSVNTHSPSGSVSPLYAGNSGNFLLMAGRIYPAGRAVHLGFQDVILFMQGSTGEGVSKLSAG